MRVQVAPYAWRHIVFAVHVSSPYLSSIFFDIRASFRSPSFVGRSASSSPNRRGCMPTALIIDIILPYIRVWGSPGTVHGRKDI
jgi:hypothetical protein